MEENISNKTLLNKIQTNIQKTYTKPWNTISVKWEKIPRVKSKSFKNCDHS